MTQLSEAGQGELEGKVRRDIARSSKESLMNGNLYSGLISVDPQHHQQVIDYLRMYQQKYGKLHPLELEQSSGSGVLIDFTEEQALNLATASDMARSNKEEPLMYVADISALTGPPGFLT